MIAAFSVLALPIQAEPVNLFKTSRLNCREWAEAANYYIDQGEENACSSLLRGAASSKKRSVRAGLICRILFESKKGRLRQPKFGSLALPYMTMPLASWPEYPMAQQDGVWFLLEENYMLGTNNEAVGEYIDYCRKNGRFRTEKVMVPTRDQATEAFKTLQGTKRWRAIQWSDSDLRNSYTYDRQWTVDMLRAQTNFTDGQYLP